MNESPTYFMVSELLDFAVRITTLMNADGADRDAYLMTLVYIENIVDAYGRSLARSSARESGMEEPDIAAMTALLNEQLDDIRKTIRDYVQAHDFDSIARPRFEALLRDWSARP